MKILFIAPLPPPVNGHSLASQIIYEYLDAKYEVKVVDLKKHSMKEGIDSLGRIKEVLSFLIQIFKKKKKIDVVYFTISESMAGNIKDLLIYLICYKKISNMYIHLHGGSIKQLLWDKYKFLSLLNQFFIKRMAGVITSGASHLEIFDFIIDKRKIHIVPDFAQDYLFLAENEIKEKFKNLEIINILFISNMIPKKGYNETLEAYLALDDKIKPKLTLNFAGRFESETSKKEFLDKIKGEKNICYHGVVEGQAKKNLFTKAHILCFPTSFLEGQGLVVLEAYASGCVVLATNSGGVRDVFENGVNGFLIAERSAKAVKDALEAMLSRKKELEAIATKNNQIATNKYRCVLYNQALESILLGSR